MHPRILAMRRSENFSATFTCFCTWLAMADVRATGERASPARPRPWAEARHVGVGWTKPSLVQKASLPVALSGRDVLLRARTGSGKTACYALPVLQKILDGKRSSFGESYGGVRAVAGRCLR